MKLDEIGRLIIKHDYFVYCFDVNHYFIFLNSRPGWRDMHVSRRLNLSSM